MHPSPQASACGVPTILLSQTLGASDQVVPAGSIPIGFVIEGQFPKWKNLVQIRINARFRHPDLSAPWIRGGAASATASATRNTSPNCKLGTMP